MAANLNDEQRQLVDDFSWEGRTRGWTIRRIQAEMAKPAADGGIGIHVSVATIDAALDRVAERLHDEYKDRVTKLKAQQTAQLEYVAEQAMDAWERSQENAEGTKVVTKAAGVKDDKGGQKGGAPAPIPGDAATTRRREVPGMYIRPDGEETDEEERASLEAIADAQAGGLVIIEQCRTEESKGQTGDPRFLEVAMKAAADVRKIWGVDAPAKADVTSAGKAISVIGYEIVAPAVAAAAENTDE